MSQEKKSSEGEQDERIFSILNILYNNSANNVSNISVIFEGELQCINLHI